TLQANINASEKGFRGGQIASGAFGCNESNYATMIHGKKGEGISIASNGLDANRAPLANGGGGSSSGNFGSGGGSHLGIGGRGGDEYSGCSLNGFYGFGGYPLLVNVSKLFLGGGGGGGYRDNNQACSPGGNGGGIIIIQAPEIIGNGFSISANGQNAPILSRDEAAGGGGAGGNILLYCSNFSGNLYLSVNGGQGGNIENTMFIGQAHGTGGGGGGGEIKLTSAVIPANVNISKVGGAAGLILHPGIYFMTNYGATEGSDGILTLNHPAISVDALNYPNIGVDTVLCNTNVFELDAGGIFTNYQWNTGETAQSIEVNSTGTYWVEVPSTCGQALRDSIYLIFSQNNFDLPNILNLCNGDTTTFSLMNQGVYQWSNSESSLNFTPENSALYTLQITDSVGCDFSDSILINLNSCEIFSLLIPNVFTPNNDGLNDYYGIVTENAISQEAIIFNRWGNKIIELNNPNLYWNGILSNGKEAQEGIYLIKYKIFGINGEEKLGHTFFHLDR
ncbi:MAG: gliding motility-associated C-terminal domain-containing protein, partial [Bacteroidota bacterium]